jgi:hypothetical protein
VLGRRKIQQEAIDEIAALPADNPYRSGVLELFSPLKVMMESRTNREADETELLMKLTQSPLFIEYMERATSEARTQGLEAERQAVVENLLSARFGTLDTELASTIPNIIKLSPSEFSPLLINLSRAELLDRFAP